MKLSLRQIFLSLFLFLLGVNPAFAFKLLPISRTFAPSGAGATQSYQVVNDSNEKLAVSVSMYERQVDLTGKESYKGADDDFLVYPPQILLQPGAQQTVKVTWVGEAQPPKELAYRMIAEQVPVDLDKPQANVTKPVGQIKVLLRYIGSVYVRPANVQPDVVLEAIAPQKKANGANELAFTLSNRGTAHAVLKNLQLHLSAGSTKVDLKPEQLKDVSGANILAGNKRRFVIPWPDGLPVGSVTATFDFEQPKD
jgi:fimbrial chaperone protein